jgi:hypothetical protein
VKLVTFALMLLLTTTACGRLGYELGARDAASDAGDATSDVGGSDGATEDGGADAAMGDAAAPDAGDAAVGDAGILVPEGLLLYLPFDERDFGDTTCELRDRSGNGRCGDAVGMTEAANIVPGRVGLALNVVGTGDYVLTDAAVERGPFTLAAWISPVRADQSRIAEDRGQGDNGFSGWQFKIDEDGGMWGFNECIVVDESGAYTGGYNKVFAGAARYTYGEWHHVAMVFDDAAGTLSLYADGELSHQYVEPGVSAYGNAFQMHIGASTYASGVAGSPQQSFFGRIDELRLYGRALTQTEVRVLSRE